MSSGRSAIGSILPQCVQSEERFGKPREESLFPDEERAIAHAVSARRREYATVRSCARTCLERLGYARVSLPHGPGGAPVWPLGARGSMTHCARYAAAAVARSDQIDAIGIDAEPDAPLPDGILDLISTPAEQEHVARMAATYDSANWDRLLFSAKEAVYKAWFPLTGGWLDPLDTEVLFHGPSETFNAWLSCGELMVDERSVTRLDGRWTRAQGILLTSVVLASRLPADAAAPGG